MAEATFHIKLENIFTDEQWEIIRLALKNGIININDVRKAASLPPVEGGDINILITKWGAIPVKHAEKYFGAMYDEVTQIQ